MKYSELIIILFVWVFGAQPLALAENESDTADSIRQQLGSFSNAFPALFVTPAVFSGETGFLMELPGAAGKNKMRLLKGDVLYFQHENKNGWTKIKINDTTDPKCCARCNCRLVEGWVVRSSIKIDSTASVDSFTDATINGREFVRKNYSAVGRFRNILMKGEIAIGMNATMVKCVYGEPNSITRTEGSWGVHEQWVYGRTSFYFENGVLKGWKE